MRFGSELAQGRGGGGGRGSRPSLQGRGCPPGPLLSGPVGSGLALGPWRRDVLFLRPVAWLGWSLEGCWWGRWQAGPAAFRVPVEQGHTGDSSRQTHVPVGEDAMKNTTPPKP